MSTEFEEFVVGIGLNHTHFSEKYGNLYEGNNLLIENNSFRSSPLLQVAKRSGKATSDSII